MNTNDDYKRESRKHTGPGGLRCACCHPRNDKARLRKAARRTLKVKLNLEWREAQKDE